MPGGRPGPKYQGEDWIILSFTLYLEKNAHGYLRMYLLLRFKLHTITKFDRSIQVEGICLTEDLFCFFLSLFFARPGEAPGKPKVLALQGLRPHASEEWDSLLEW